jgi:predicted  nucleic acid-binding Zn-ribbon protein
MSLAQAILSGIRRKKEDVAIQAVSPEFRYYEILRALADDQEADENELEGVLEELGKQDFEFEKDLDQMQERVQAAKTLRGKEAAERELVTLQNEHTETAREFERIRQEFDHRLRGLYGQIQQKILAISNSETARLILHRNQPNPILLATENRLRRELQEASEPVRELNAELSLSSDPSPSTGLRLHSAKNALEAAKTPEDKLQAAQAVEEWQRRFDALTRELEDRKQERRAVETELNKVLAQRLIP